jgi:nucleoside-diphosphate-sugar epimerase
MDTKRQILITGGAGYVGAVLVPRLLSCGYRVRVLDLHLFGRDVFGVAEGHPALEQITGDIRDEALLREVLPGCDTVIHLACISNDPSFALNPALSRSINFDAFRPLVQASKACGISRFIYASTSSVYGVSDAPDVTEEHPLVPITDYNKYKGLCEPILRAEQSPDFTTVIVRPATVCGFSPRQRLDLTVNILTSQAVHRGEITVFGGAQTRPNIHIEDMVDLYLLLLEAPAEQIGGKTFNAGYQNHTITEIAEMVRDVVAEEMPERPPIAIARSPSDDPRSYRISSERMRRELGFIPQRSVQDAVRDLVQAFQAGKIPNAMTDDRYYNVKTLQQANLS